MPVPRVGHHQALDDPRATLGGSPPFADVGAGIPTGANAPGRSPEPRGRSRRQDARRDPHTSKRPSTHVPTADTTEVATSARTSASTSSSRTWPLDGHVPRTRHGADAPPRANAPTRAGKPSSTRQSDGHDALPTTTRAGRPSTSTRTSARPLSVSCRLPGHSHQSSPPPTTGGRSKRLQSSAVHRCVAHVTASAHTTARPRSGAGRTRPPTTADGRPCRLPRTTSSTAAASTSHTPEAGPEESPRTQRATAATPTARRTVAGDGTNGSSSARQRSGWWRAIRAVKASSRNRSPGGSSATTAHRVPTRSSRSARTVSAGTGCAHGDSSSVGQRRRTGQRRGEPSGCREPLVDNDAHRRHTSTSVRSPVDASVQRSSTSGSGTVRGTSVPARRCPGTHLGSSTHHAHNGFGVHVGSAPAASRHSAEAPSRARSSAPTSTSSPTGSTSSSPVPRVVRGDAKGRRSAAQRLDERVEVEIAAVLKPPPARLDLDDAHRHALLCRTPECQVGGAGQHDPPSGERDLHPVLGPWQPAGTRDGPVPGDVSCVLGHVVEQLTAPGLGERRHECDDAVAITIGGERTERVRGGVRDRTGRHPLAEQRVHHAAAGDRHAHHRGSGQPGRHVGLAHEHLVEGLLAHPDRGGVDGRTRHDRGQAVLEPLPEASRQTGRDQRAGDSVPAQPGDQQGRGTSATVRVVIGSLTGMPPGCPPGVSVVGHRGAPPRHGPPTAAPSPVPWPGHAPSPFGALGHHAHSRGVSSGPGHTPAPDEAPAGPQQASPSRRAAGSHGAGWSTMSAAFAVVFGLFVVLIVVVAFLAVRWALRHDKAARAGRAVDDDTPGPPPEGGTATPHRTLARAEGQRTRWAPHPSPISGANPWSFAPERPELGKDGQGSSVRCRRAGGRHAGSAPAGDVTMSGPDLDQRDTPARALAGRPALPGGVFMGPGGVATMGRPPPPHRRPAAPGTHGLCLRRRRLTGCGPDRHAPGPDGPGHHGRRRLRRLGGCHQRRRLLRDSQRGGRRAHGGPLAGHHPGGRLPPGSLPHALAVLPTTARRSTRTTVCA